MKTPIDMISGFLGAGKTTLLNHMLSTVYQGMHIAIVENEFGDESIDGTLLPTDMTVVEMTGGCACCTIRVGLIEGLMELIGQNKFDRIVIEPTGVAKLSDMLSILHTKQLKDITRLGAAITVVNPIFHMRYSQSMGEFYLDQIKHSSAVYINRLDQVKPEALTDIIADIKLKHNIPVLTTLTDNLLENAHSHIHNHVNHVHVHQHDHTHHHHDADDAFATKVVMPDPEMKYEDINAYIAKTVAETQGEVLRIKGFVKTKDGDYLVQWAPGELSVTPRPAAQSKLIVIYRVST